MTFDFENIKNQDTEADNLKLEVWCINMAIRKAFADQQLKIDNITWNPRRGGQTSDRFNIHSIQVTVGAWQETLYRIETRDIKNYANGIKRESIEYRIAELLQKFLHHIADSSVTGSRKRALRTPRHLAR